MEKKRLYWYALLFINVVLFVYGVLNRDLLVLFISMALATLINFKGNKAMFSSFETKQRIKYRSNLTKFLKNKK